MERMSHYKIFETDNYDQFKKLLGNRDITPARISSIKESILRIGYQPSPILINEKKEIIDGQGRLAACKSLNLPVFYIEKKGLTISDCMSMNRKMKAWTTPDYINSYADRDYPAYVKLRNDLREYRPLDWAMLLTIKGRGYNVTVQDALRDGKLQYVGLDYKERECARWICAIHPYVIRSGFAKKATLETLIRLYRYELIDSKRMLESFEKYGDQFNGGRLRSKDILQDINALYNYNRKHIVYFADDYRRKALEATGQKKKDEQQKQR